MIVSWKDDAGVTHTGDDQGKAYKRHRAARKGEATPAEGGAVVKTVEVDARPPVTEATEQSAEADAATDRPKRTR
ncbi:hypothetical protein [Nocardia sp. N2S4-5]|uniref:hypothetical protein n=1 Tax=Nocardia sp. N2S4-5 TaxID=3351565 RepID=UPI0037CE5E3C